VSRLTAIIDAADPAERNQALEADQEEVIAADQQRRQPQAWTLN